MPSAATHGGRALISGYVGVVSFVASLVVARALEKYVARAYDETRSLRGNVLRLMQIVAASAVGQYVTSQVITLGALRPFGWQDALPAGGRGVMWTGFVYALFLRDAVATYEPLLRTLVVP